MVSRFSVCHVIGVHVNNVVMIFETEVVCFVVRGIHFFMILIRTHSTTLQISPITHHIHTSKYHIVQISMMHRIKIHQTFLVSTVEVHILALIVKQGIHFLVTITTIHITTNLHSAK